MAGDLDDILAIAREHGVPVIEDNAHGLGGTYRGRPLGSFGAMATQSFHATKNVSCGEGGALIVNDERYRERAEIIREKGTNRGQFLRGMVDKYRWMDIGSSYLPSDLLAAFLTLEEFPGRYWQYGAGLDGWVATLILVRDLVLVAIVLVAAAPAAPRLRGSGGTSRSRSLGPSAHRTR